MPLPALVGFAWFGSVLTGLFVSVFTAVAALLTKRLAVVVAAVVIIAGLVVALFAGLEALTSGLALVLPAYLTSGIAMFLPTNLSACISIIVSAHLLRYAYDWNVRIVQYKLF